MSQNQVIGGFRRSDPRLINLKGIIHESFALEGELTQLALRIYPAQGLKELIEDGLIPVNRQIRELFCSAYNAISGDPNWKPSSQVVAALRLWLGGYFHMIVRAIAEADIKSHPIEMMTVIRHWLKQVGQTECGIITTPRDELNFAVRELWSGFVGILESEIGIQSEVRRQYVNLLFPRLYKDNVLLSGVYAHELGHFLDTQLGLWEKVFVEHALQHPSMKLIDGQIIDLKRGKLLVGTTLAAEMRERIMGPWIREFIADTYGVFLLGPAFVFSADMIDSYLYLTSTLNGDLPDDLVSISHPRTSLRVAHRIALLRDYGYLAELPSILRDRIEDIETWWSQSRVRVLFNQHLSMPKDVISVVERVVQDCLPAIRDLVYDAAKELLFEPHQLRVAERLAREKLAHLIPPNEIDGQPANPATIINAGWFVHHGVYEFDADRFDRSSGHYGSYSQQQLLNGLLRYALYASHIHQRWVES